MPRLSPEPRRQAATGAMAGGRAGALICAVACAVACAAGVAAAATLDVTGPHGTVLRVDGLEVGTLPLPAPLTLGPGTYRVEGALPGFRPYVQTVRLDEGERQFLLLRLERLSRRTAWTSSILYAGLGQFYLDKPTRGWLYAAAETGGLLAALAGELQRSNLRKDYLVLQDAYDTAINGDEAAYYRAEAAQAYADMEDAEKIRDTGLVVALAAIGISVIDALVTFPGVDAGPGPVAPVTGYAPELPGAPSGGLTSVHAAVKLTF